MLKIDKYKVILNPNFQESSLTIEGLFKKSKIKIVIIHGSKSTTTQNTMFYFLVKST